MCIVIKTLPSFKEAELAKVSVNPRKIVSRDRSGLCAKHQRVLATEIKRAHLNASPVCQLRSVTIIVSSY